LNQTEQDQFEKLCFDFGVELDDVTSEKAEIEKEVGAGARAEGASEEVLYKIDIPANRYDLLCMEGITSALRVFLGKDEPPRYQTTPAKLKTIVEPSVNVIRPFVVCAVLRNITFDQNVYDSFIDLQDKLHHNICRERTLVSIGTHDLDAIEAPFYYRANSPADIKFTPLNRSKELDGNETMTALESDLHLKRYLYIIRKSPVYPVVCDNRNKVLSLPPIINSEYSKITLNTKNVFIEVTATDLTKANVVLDTMCTMFAQYCVPALQVEQVTVEYPDGSSMVTPQLEPRKIEVSTANINQMLELNLSSQEILVLLKKMLLSGTETQPGKLEIDIPPTRSDIFHEVDVIEDVAIAYGYNNLNVVPPKTVCNGAQQPLNMLTDLLRYELAYAGYTEILTFALCSYAENYALLRRPDDNLAVKIGNPKTVDFEIGRTNLVSGLLKTLSNNKKLPIPVKLFEIADVILRDNSVDVGAINSRRAAVLYSDSIGRFEYVHGVLDQLMLKLNISKSRYYLDAVSCTDEALFPGMRANVIVDDKPIGVIGVVHPEVVKNFDLTFPCSVLEIDIQVFNKV